MNYYGQLISDISQIH